MIGTLATMPGHASAAGWLPRTSTPPGTAEVDAQDLAVDAQGNAVAVWTSYGTWRVTQAATRPVGGSWSAPITFLVAGEEDGWDPRVAVGANGDAVAVWTSARGQYKAIVMAATRTAGGGWSEPVALSDEDGFAFANQARVVVDAQGDATALWGEYIGDASVVRTSTHPQGGDWSEPVDLTDSLSARDPELTVDAQGEVTAIWTWHGPQNGGGIIQASSRSPEGTWSEPVDLSDSDELAGFSQVAVNPQGDAAAVWESYRVGYDHPRIQAARRTAGVGWGPAVDLSDTDGGNPDVAIDPQGTATAVWESNDSSGRLVHASTSAPGGPWSAPVDLSTRDDGYSWGAFPQVTTDPQGNVTVIWRRFQEPFHNRVMAARREAGGEWGAPVDIDETNGVIEPRRVAVDPQGYVTVAWTLGSQLSSSVFDPVAPQLSDVTVPASGIVGQPVAMSVDPFDVWSPVATAWDFGDGSAGSGVTAQHCYSTPGERTVSVTGTDGAANTTSATRAITIEPDPGLAGGVDPCAEPEPPDPPQLTGTDPSSPGSSGTPRILGAAEAGSTVHLYAGSTCSGAPVATGTAAELGSLGIFVQVAEGVTAVFSATATDPGANTSDCSAPISYTRVKALTDQGGGGGDGGPTDEGKDPDPSPACIVPRLNGKTLAQAKAALKAAACGLGTVRRPRHRQGRRTPPLLVRSSTPAAGARPDSGKVNLTLGPKPRKRAASWWDWVKWLVSAGG